MADFTPMMKQYIETRKKYHDCILLFRLGDFYEMFLEDAKLASKLLGIVLTSRKAGKGNKIPMAGIPYHSANNYITKLIRAGKKIAICEQVEDPKFAKGIVKREVVKVITPGTVLEPNLLDDKSNNYIMSLIRNRNFIGISVVDITTGESLVSEFEDKNLNKLDNEIFKFKPSECIIPEQDTELLGILKKYEFISINPYESFAFEYIQARELLISHFTRAEYRGKTTSLSGFGIDGLTYCICAYGALLKYLKETQLTTIEHINKVRFYSILDYMIIDSSTLRNLELVSRSYSDNGRAGTLLAVMDHTKTSMGARMLKNWILQPLLNIPKIKERQEGVEELYKDTLKRKSLEELLDKIYDIERLAGRIGCKVANARDLISLKESIKIIPLIKEKLKDFNSFILQDIKNIDELPDMEELIEKSILHEPSVDLKSGNLIKQGYNEELDNIKNEIKDVKDWIASLQEKERKRTRISSLKVRFNTVFGYYIEVSKANLENVPDDYIRKQTLVNAERFITPELKEYESKVLGAEERIRELEYNLFCEIRDKISGNIDRIQKTAFYLALLDTLVSLAEVAANYNYVKPEVNESDCLEIKDGRHPVIERIIQEQFVPNDTNLNNTENQILIITGPNMAGKSTYLRQVALLVLMSQIGSFIPAEKASIGIVDRIFTRVGASDNIVYGQSTFMVEMTEVANILNNATNKSLIILDEVGRGTSTFDGISIAWAVVEYLHNEKNISAKTLFATHFYELTELTLTLSRVKNYNIAVKEYNDNIMFLRKIVEGSADRSYGIQVARLAGLPRQVLERAKEVLTNLEKVNYSDDGKSNIGKHIEEKENFSQMSLLDEAERHLAETEHKLTNELKKIDVDNITPIQALSKLNELKKSIDI